MYKVDVLNLKNKLDELNNLLEIYQENYLNMYHQIEISNEDELWYDPHAKVFFDDKVVEKTNIEESYVELNEIYSTIDNIINKYNTIGGVVEFDLTNKNALLSKFNIHKNKLNRILSSYNDLDYSFASSEIVNAINNQISNIKEQIYLSDTLKEEIVSIIDRIKEYEIDIARLIKRISIKKIQYVDVDKYLTSEVNGHFDRSVINTEEIGNVIKKMSLYSDLESTNFIGILNNLKTILDLYKTTNTMSFELIIENVNNKFENIKDLNTCNIQVLEKNVDKYQQVEKEVTIDATKIGA